MDPDPDLQKNMIQIYALENGSESGTSEEQDPDSIFYINWVRLRNSFTDTIHSHASCTKILLFPARILTAIIFCYLWI